MIIWNPWHGCHKMSEGCEHCYMYFLDRKRGIDTSKVYRTESFYMPLQKKRDGSYKYPSGMEMYVGLSTDFFVQEADAWRDEAWRIIKSRPDMVFRFLTKRADRIEECLPKDWGEGYENVLLSVTTENQRNADNRLPILLALPAKHKGFMAAPFIGSLDASAYLATGEIEEVLCGGENYDGARPCHYEWVKSLSDQCRKQNVTFDFIETGSYFVKDGKTYHIPNKQIQSKQAYLSGLSFQGKPIYYKLRLPEGNLFGQEQPIPSLFTFNIADKAFKDLMGTVVEPVMTSMPGTKFKAQGPLLITHWGMSGPAVLKLSSHAARHLHENNYQVKISVNWVNESNRSLVEENIRSIIAANPQKQLASIRPYNLPSRLWLYLIQKMGYAPEKKWSEMGKKGSNLLIETLTNDLYQTNGKGAHKEEFVTCGGISLTGIDLHTLESKVCPHLFFAGEVLDIDAITGGFNLQAAWTTGFVVGQHIIN